MMTEPENWKIQKISEYILGRDKNMKQKLKAWSVE